MEAVQLRDSGRMLVGTLAVALGEMLSLAFTVVLLKNKTPVRPEIGLVVGMAVAVGGVLLFGVLLVRLPSLRVEVRGGELAAHRVFGTRRVQCADVVDVVPGASGPINLGFHPLYVACRNGDRVSLSPSVMYYDRNPGRIAEIRAGLQACLGDGPMNTTKH